MSTGFKETIQWYDEHAEEYAQAGASYFDLNHIENFVKLLPKAAKVLDAGCGPGRDAALLKKAGLEVVGVDISKGLLNVARKHFPDIEFIEGNLLELPFDDSSFDGVWSNTSLLHLETIEQVQKALGEMSRILKKNGILHVVVKAQTGDAKTAVVSDKLSGHDRFFQYFTKEEMSELITKAGFDITSIKEYSEIETIPNGRPEVRIIWCLAQKH